MCAQSEGRKKDKAARPALARRQAARKTNEAADDFAATVLKMIRS